MSTNSLRLIELLELYDVHTIITRDYFNHQTYTIDLVIDFRDDLLKFGHYEYFPKLNVLYFEVLPNETK